MTDSAQAVVNRYSYGSFGVVQRSETVWNDFTYTGREYDYETGLYYYRARYYDPNPIPVVKTKKMAVYGVEEPALVLSLSLSLS
jgi:hypothetical protein